MLGHKVSGAPLQTVATYRTREPPARIVKDFARYDSRLLPQPSKQQVSLDVEQAGFEWHGQIELIGGMVEITAQMVDELQRRSMRQPR